MARHRWYRSALLVLALACLAGRGAVGRAAVTGPSLFGESLQARVFTAGTVTTSGVSNCNPAGTSTVSFTAQGPATGPYPGTFEASGTVTIGPQLQQQTNGLPFGDVTSFQETFTIYSGETTVTGTKQLYSGPLLGGESGICASVPPGEFPDLVGSEGGGDVLQLVNPAQYTATISGPSGTFTDSGLSDNAVEEIDNPAGFRTPPTFNEGFVVSFTSASTKGEVKGGGEVDAPDGTPLVTFDVAAKSGDNGKLGGGCEVVDHTTGQVIDCQTVDTYFESGTTVVFTGQATVDGAPTGYQIQVFDDDSSGTNSDTFSIQTDSGYSAAGVLAKGSIEVK